MKANHRARRVVLLLAGALGLIVAGGSAGVVLLLSGAFSTAATKQHFLITHRILDAGLHYSVIATAQDFSAPPLDGEALQSQGLACYQTHCVQCHGAPGIAPGQAAMGMLPIPGNLAQTAREWPAEWIYYVTRKGVRMTGMPAWEYRLPDASLWSVVAFLQTLPSLTRDEYLRRVDAVDEACAERDDLPEPGGGEVLLRQYACDSCHIIEGVVGPRSFAGPPLRDWSRRKYIAGMLPNTRVNLARWIESPRSISPDTLMPDLDVPPAHAQAMVTFLFAQEGAR